MRVVALTVPACDAELAADRLWAAGAQAVEELDVGVGVIELRSVVGHDDEATRRRMGVVPTDWSLEFVDVDEQPTETWRDFAQPIEVGERLEIRPAWRDSTNRPGVLSVAIEPAASFGLGDHPTTRLAAAAVDAAVRPGDRVIDVGCGSGVLAIVAALRGADLVVAIDIADAACEAATDNATRNGVAGVIDVSSVAVSEIDGEFDLVVANILAPTLIVLAPDLRRLTAHDGRLVIAGVLTDGYDHVVAALSPMVVVSTDDLEGWSSVMLAHAR